MREVPKAIARWLERKRRSERGMAVVLAAIALGSGAAVFLVMALLIYAVLSVVCGAFLHSISSWIGLAALGLTAGLFARNAKVSQDSPELGLDPMGFWVVSDICSIGPRLILEGLRQVRRQGQLGELDVSGCARALAYLASQNSGVAWEDLIRHCPQLPSARLRECLLLLDGVLFLGEDASRVLLMEPFRLRLRSMLEPETRAGKEREPARPGPEVPPPGVPVNDPEKLSAYEILGLSPSASLVEIKKAYRKRVKECHPDLFAGMDEQARDSAERWTTALNAAYATLNPRRPNDARPRPKRQRSAP
jgi:hypothetical protein